MTVGTGGPLSATATHVPPKVLYLEPIGVRGGMGRYNEALIMAYENAGAQVEFVTSSHDSSYGFRAKVHVSRFFRLALDRSKPRVLRAGGYVLGYLSCLPLARRSDIVVMHFLHRPSIDRWALRAFRRLGPRLVLVAHDPQPVLRAQGGIAFQRALGAFDLIVVHGPKARIDIIAQGALGDRVVVAPFGEYRNSIPLDATAARSALGIENMARPVAAIIGNLKPGKGIKRAREALETQSSLVGTLLVAGRRQDDWDLEGALRIPADSHLCVVRIDRRMSDQEELAAYSLADVVLALYDSGYSSAVIARAHSIGEPVVLTDVGDLAQQALPLDAVLPVDYSPEQLCEAIRRCIQAGRHAPDAWNVAAWALHAKTVLDRVG